MIDIKDMIQFVDLWSRLDPATQDQIKSIFVDFPEKTIADLLQQKLILEESLDPINSFLEQLEDLYPSSLVAENAAEVISEIYYLSED